MKKQTKVLLLAVLALCLLTACKKENAALEVYTLGESEADAVVALDTILEEDEAVLASIDAPTRRSRRDWRFTTPTTIGRCTIRQLWPRAISLSCGRRSRALPS